MEYKDEERVEDKEKRFRGWVFTKWSNCDFESIKCKYIVVGHEFAPTTGKEHWQGYVEFKDPKGISAVKKIFNDNGMYLWKRKGTPEDASIYCKKDKEYVEYGQISQQGKRTDLEVLRKMIKEKKEDFEIVEEVTSLMAVKCIDTVRNKMIAPRTEKPRVEWLHGETGCGKSRMAVEKFNNDYDSCDFVNGFLIGYTGNDNVLFDDFRGQIPLNTLLKMLDRYKCVVNTKGGCCHFSPKYIIFTSPFDYKKTYSNCKNENLLQLKRRIDLDFGFEKTQNTEVGGNIMPRLSDLMDSDLSEEEHDE